MNIPELIKIFKAQETFIDVSMTSLPTSYLNRQGILINKEAETTLADVNIHFRRSEPYVRLHLVHNNCVRYRKNFIKSLPYFCKYCGTQPLTEENAEILGLPLKPAIPKMQVMVMGPNGFYYNEKPRFEVANMLLWDDQWWHQCPNGPATRFGRSRLTIKKFPHKCKNCKQLLGDASFNLKSAFKLPKLV